MSIPFTKDHNTYVFWIVPVIKISFWVTGLQNAYKGCQDPNFKLMSYADEELRFEAAKDLTLQV